MPSSPSRAWALREGTDQELPGFNLDWIPPAAYKYLSVRSRRRGPLVLRTDGYVGAIPLLNGDTLRLLPKAGRKALGRMLMVSESLDRSLEHEFDKFVSVGFSADDDLDWLGLLARAFARALLNIEAKSLRFQRNQVTNRLAFARGRVDPSRTSIAIARHDSRPVLCSYRVRSTDTLEHRFLALAAWHVLRSHPTEAEQRAVLVRWVNRFDISIDSRDRRRVLSDLQSGAYSGSRPYYVSALTLAYLLLSSAGLALDSPDEVSSEPILLNVADLFERYVRAIVLRGLSDRGWIVQKGVSPPTSLFHDGTCELIPDVTVSDGRGVRLLADAKYKIGSVVQPSDYYQACAYARALQVNTVVIVRPTDEDSPQNSEIRRSTVDNILVVELRLDLDDWGITEDWLAARVRDLLPPMSL